MRAPPTPLLWDVLELQHSGGSSDSGGANHAHSALSPACLGNLHSRRPPDGLPYASVCPPDGLPYASVCTASFKTRWLDLWA